MSNILFVRWQNIVDFLVLVTVIYWLLRWGRQTRVLRLFVGIGALVLTGSLARQLDLIVTAWVLHVAEIAAVVLLVVVYHSEIRPALTHLDPLNRLVRRMPSEPTSEGIAIAQTAFALAATKRGALMILARKDSLKNLLTGGVPLEGMISREILDAIFRKVSPVHDGAVVIEAGRISRVGVFLPLTSREDLPNYYGTRHRAAIGLAEQSDAKVIVVSAERGEVSLVEESVIRRMENVTDLIQQMPRAGTSESSLSSRKIRARLFGNLKLKVLASGMASLIWGLVFMTGVSVRTFTAPIEYENVPAGLEITDPSNTMLAVQLRAATRLFNTLDENQLVVRVNLLGMKEGLHVIAVESQNLNLPPGISLEQATPPTLTVLLIRR